MVLYSTEALSEYELTDDELVGMIEDAYKTSNTAMKNSEIDLELNLVHVGLVSARVEQATQNVVVVLLRGSSEVTLMSNVLSEICICVSVVLPVRHRATTSGELRAARARAPGSWGCCHMAKDKIGTGKCFPLIHCRNK